MLSRGTAVSVVVGSGGPVAVVEPFPWMVVDWSQAASLPFGSRNQYPKITETVPWRRFR